MTNSNSSKQSRRDVLKYSGVAGATLLAGCMGGGDSDSTWYLASSSQDSVGYSNGAAIGELVTENSDTIDLEATPTEGFSSNIPRVSDGEDELGWMIENDYYSAREGQEPFDGPVDPLPQRITPTTHLSQSYIATEVDNDIESLEDLSGKTISFLMRGAAANAVIEATLREAGIYDDVTIEYEGHPGTRDAVIEGRVDAWVPIVTTGWLHLAPYTEIMESVDTEPVPIPEDIHSVAVEEQPGWEYAEWETDLAEFETDQETWGVYQSAAGFAGHPDLDDDDVYEFLDVTLSHQEEIGEIHPMLETYGFGDSPAPIGDRLGFEGIDSETEFHPGAIQYYEDEGIEMP